MHQVLKLGHSSLIFEYCILWNSLLTEIVFEGVSFSTRLLGAWLSVMLHLPGILPHDFRLRSWRRNQRQYCLVGNTAQHCRLGCSTRLEINLGEVNLICIRKANICSHQLDVQEANVSVSRFHRIGSCFFGCLFANGWYSCSRSMGCGDRIIAFFEERPSSSERSLSKRKGRWSSAGKSSTQWNPKHKSQNQTEKSRWPRSWWTVQYGSSCHKRKTFSFRRLIMLKTEAVVKMIIKRQKADNETRIPNPQSCARLFVWQS